MNREPFLRRLDVPVLVWEAPDSRGPFSLGRTRLIEESKTAPPIRELLLQGHRFPVLELRQRSSESAGEIRLGRSADNDIVVSDDTVSLEHALFQRDDRSGAYAVQDLCSTNGSQINGRPQFANKAVILFDGDLLEFGDSLFLFFYPEGWYEVLKTLT